MLRLNIVIADSDEKYLEGLTSYLIDYLSNKFQVNSFSNKENFKDYVEKNARFLDVVIVSPELYFDELDSLSIKLNCILSDGKLSREYNNYQLIDKYALADTIASNIIKFYSEKTNVIINQKGNKEYTRTIAVYSPLSGSGKTTVAYAMALKAAQLGKDVFYLNLEDNATTDLFLNTDSQEDLSHILFYLKSKNKNLSVKIDTVKQVDNQRGIHYFSPAKSNLEIDEVTPDEYLMLLRELKNMRNYDYVIVDLSSGFTGKIATVLGEVDRIVFLVTNELQLKVKAQGIGKDFEILYSKQRINLYNKLTVINNKHNSSNNVLGNFSIGGATISHNVPYAEQLLLRQGDKYSINISGDFGNSIDELIHKLS